MNMPINETTIMFWAARFLIEHDRKPKVSELPEDLQIALGKKVFEFADYRDICFTDLPDEALYCACLESHYVDRDRPDGIDVALYFNKKF